MDAYKYFSLEQLSVLIERGLTAKTVSASSDVNFHLKIYNRGLETDSIRLDKLQYSWEKEDPALEEKNRKRVNKFCEKQLNISVQNPKTANGGSREYVIYFIGGYFPDPKGKKAVNFYKFIPLAHGEMSQSWDSTMIAKIYGIMERYEDIAKDIVKLSRKAPEKRHVFLFNDKYIHSTIIPEMLADAGVFCLSGFKTEFFSGYCLQTIKNGEETESVLLGRRPQILDIDISVPNKKKVDVIDSDKEEDVIDSDSMKYQLFYFKEDFPRDNHGKTAKFTTPHNGVYEEMNHPDFHFGRSFSKNDESVDEIVNHIVREQRRSSRRTFFLFSTDTLN